MRRATLVFVGCWACGGPEVSPAAVDPLDFAIDAPGPFRVGFRAWTTAYPVLGESREITVNVWYPTEDEAGEAVRYAGIAPDDLALGDAAPIVPAHPDGFPLHAHSHGHQGYGGTSAELMRWMASHGWVSVAPDHAGNLLLDDPADEVAYFDALRPLDVKAAVDALDALPESDPLSVTFTDRYVLSGHSRGVTTVWSVLGATFDMSEPSRVCDGCGSDARALFTDGSVVDPRAVAAIPMAGGYNESTFTDDGWRAVSAPLLAMSGTNDNPEEARATWEAIDAIDYRWLELDGGCHQTFALGVCNSLDPTEGFWMVDTYALAFARARLLGDDDPRVRGLLDGTESLDPRATLSVRP